MSKAASTTKRNNQVKKHQPRKDEKKKSLGKAKQKAYKYEAKHTSGVSNQLQDKIPTVWANSLVNQLKVAVPFDTPSLNLALAGWVSFLISRGIHENEKNQGLVNPWESVYNGAAYMMQGILTQIGGSTLTLSRLPRGIDELIAALSPTDVPALRYAKVSYTWDSLPSPLPPGFEHIVNADGIWTTTYVNEDNQTYNSPAYEYVSNASQSAYSDLLKMIGSLGNTEYLKIVDNGESAHSKALRKDASAFARVYRYNGLDPVPTSGYYKNVELETKINAPMYSNFCEYANPDLRVPQDLQRYTGDACVPASWNLHPTFTSPFNHSPIQFKQIDFEEIFYCLAIWAAKAKEALAISGSNNDPEYTGPFSFTQQDFRIVLRQALLNVFDTQYFAQFTGSVAADGKSNAFVPFMIMGHCWPSNYFDQFKLPDLIAENINNLRARNLIVPGKSKVNTPTLVPILGRYYQDIVPIIQYKLAGVDTDLFANTPQNPIGLTDCRTGQNQYINVNGGYYQAVMANWNEFVERAAAVTSKYGNIVKDSGPAGLGLLHFTRVEEHADDETRRALATNSMYVRNLRYIKNSGIPATSGTKGGSKAIPPASIVSLQQVISTTSIPFTPSHEEFYNMVIGPTIRLSSSEDAITCSMYQVEVKEYFSLYTTRRAGPSGTGMSTKMAALAQLCITGEAKQDTNVYTMVMDKLNQHGNAGMLAQLLGGFAKRVIPGADGIIDTIASVVPI